MKQSSAALGKLKKDMPCIKNPLMVRKKFEMKDVYFRRDMPEQEVFRCELAFNTELYVLLVAAITVLILILFKICRAASTCKMRRYERMRFKSRKHQHHN